MTARDPNARLTDDELVELAKHGSPAMQSAARELLDARGVAMAPGDYSRRYPLAKLCERLLADGYVRADRAEELRQRAANMLAGRGFVPDAPPVPGVEDALRRLGV